MKIFCKYFCDQNGDVGTWNQNGGYCRESQGITPINVHRTRIDENLELFTPGTEKRNPSASMIFHQLPRYAEVESRARYTE